MQNRPHDLPYCGVRKDRIEVAKPKLNPEVLQYLYDFINRRYLIHLRKDVKKLPPPWIRDEVLQQFRFTNVRREHDYESKWLINHVSTNKELSYEDKLLNTILFRIYNKHETAEVIGMPIPFSKMGDWDPEMYQPMFDEARKKNPHMIFFTGVFITGGVVRALQHYLPEDKKDVSKSLRVMYFMKHLCSTSYVEKLKHAQKGNQKDVYTVLNNTMGLGKFLAYQIFVDFTYIPEFPFSENEFVMSGPGCSNGLHSLFEDADGMTCEECLFWLRDNLDRVFREQIKETWDSKKLFVDLPEEDRHFNVMSLENCFCELSKYVRTKRGTGRPRQKYKRRVEETV